MAFDHLDDGKFADERTALAALLAARPLGPQDREAVQGEAEALVRAARKNANRQGGGQRRAFIGELAVVQVIERHWCLQGIAASGVIHPSPNVLR